MRSERPYRPARTRRLRKTMACSLRPLDPAPSSTRHAVGSTRHGGNCPTRQSSHRRTARGPRQEARDQVPRQSHQENERRQENATGHKKLAAAIDIPGEIISDEVNEPGANHYLRKLTKGTYLRIIDLGGQQAVDFLCFDQANPEIPLQLRQFDQAQRDALHHDRLQALFRYRRGAHDAHRRHRRQARHHRRRLQQPGELPPLRDQEHLQLPRQLHLRARNRRHRTARHPFQYQLLHARPGRQERPHRHPRRPVTAGRLRRAPRRQGRDGGHFELPAILQSVLGLEPDPDPPHRMAAGIVAGPVRDVPHSQPKQDLRQPSRGPGDEIDEQPGQQDHHHERDHTPVHVHVRDLLRCDRSKIEDRRRHRRREIGRLQNRQHENAEPERIDPQNRQHRIEDRDVIRRIEIHSSTNPRTNTTNRNTMIVAVGAQVEERDAFLDHRMTAVHHEDAGEHGAAEDDRHGHGADEDVRLNAL